MSKHRQAARGRACVRCGIEDETVVLAHYQGPYSHWFGKGKAVKPHDLAGAWLCHRCHDLMDGRTRSPIWREMYPKEREEEKRELALEFAILCLQTVIIRYDEGQFRD